MRLEPGARIARCEVVRFLGISDDNAVLYLAARGSERVVIARYEDLADDEFVRMRFDEATYLTALRHPRIRRIRAIGRDDGHYVCVLEHVPGAELGRIVRAARDRGALVGFDVAISAGIAVAEALDYLHDAKSANGTPLQIVHGDVKAWNVLVGEDDAVKLDLGALMRISRRDLSGKRLWLSPEQVRGRPLDRRSDLFQVGIMLYELVTGRFPFPGDDELAVYQQITGSDVEPPGRRTPSLPAELERIMLRALARDLDERYATARELLVDLAQLGLALRIETSIALATLVAKVPGRAS